MRLLFIIVLLWATAGTATAQVVTDGTVGPAGALAGPDYAVTGQCAPTARITSGGRFHPESCRLIW